MWRPVLPKQLQIPSGHRHQAWPTGRCGRSQPKRTPKSRPPRAKPQNASDLELEPSWEWSRNREGKTAKMTNAARRTSSYYNMIAYSARSELRRV
jgi:hypothetical protein